MTLSAGDKLGPYEIVTAIGQGGMGAVYRARDTRLGRDVAIKVSDQKFGERFEREARVISSLNHPNICTLYDVGPNYLVMELVEGQTLAERISEGAIPLEESLNVGKQIADALEAAHEKGVVHRDLKPGNVMIRTDGSVKVLDFGLAKVAQRGSASDSDNPDLSPTISMAATQAGVVLGTAAYMSPEQARGKPVDKRADIWAFGVVLYEMVTGKQLFAREDLTDTLASVVKIDPDLSACAARIQPLLKKCLEKDPRKRLRDISGVELLLDAGLTESQLRAASESGERVSADAAKVAAAKSRLIPWAVAAGAIVLLGIVSFALTRTELPDRPLKRFSVDLGPNAIRTPRKTVIISPDGTRIAYTGRGDGGLNIYTRRLDQPGETLLASDASEFPILFFSPDGEWVGYMAGDGNLKKVSVDGGAPLGLGIQSGQIAAASWADDDTILVGGVNGLLRVPATGKMPEQLTEGIDVFQDVLPGSGAVLFNAAPAAGQAPSSLDSLEIRVLDLASGESKVLVDAGYFPRYVPTFGETGHVIYISQGTLFAAPFDPRSLELLGAPTPLLSDIAADSDVNFGGGQFSASDEGTLVYLAGGGGEGSYPISFMDAEGAFTPVMAQPGLYGAPRLSPDGRQLAYIAPGANGSDLWVTDLERKTPTQVTFIGTVNFEVAWAPDSMHLVYGDGKALRWIRSDGAGEAQLLADDLSGPRATSFVRTGENSGRLMFSIATNGLPDSLSMPIDLSDPEAPVAGDSEPFLTEPGLVEVDGAFSPDGKFIAYASNESGAEQIFVRPFPGPGGRWKVSTNGGKFPAWAADTNQLFFLGGDDRIMVADYTTEGDSFSVGNPRAWSQRQVRRNGVRQSFDVTADGKHVVVFPRAEAGSLEGMFSNVFVEFFR